MVQTDKHTDMATLWPTRPHWGLTNERPGNDHVISGQMRGLKILPLMAQTNRQTHTQTDRHGDSMTKSAQWGRFSENSLDGHSSFSYLCNHDAVYRAAPGFAGFAKMVNKPIIFKEDIIYFICLTFPSAIVQYYPYSVKCTVLQCTPESLVRI